MAAKSASPASTQILSEIGFVDLPDNWGVVRIEDLLCNERGISVGVMYPGEHDPAGIPLIKAGDLAGSLINPNPEFRITPKKHFEYRRTELSGGELLISLVGDVGRCALVPPNMTGWNAARAVAVLRFKSEADAAFVRACLLSPPFQHLMRAWSTTTVQATLNLKEIRQIPLPWPPARQRGAIAHILGTLDDKIELNRRRNQTLEAMARALFKDWFVDFGPVRANMEGHEPYLPAELWELFPDCLDDEGKPQGWEIQPLSELLTIIGGGTPKTSVEDYWNGDIPWFSVVDTPSASDVFVVATAKTITAQGLAGSSARLIPKGTTIISARGTVGNLAIAGQEMTFNQSCYGLRGAGGAGDYFVYLTAQHMVDQLKSMAHGSVFSTITRQTFEAIRRPVPPPGVLTIFERLVAEWFDSILSNVEESRVLAQLRDTLLPKLISGDLRVSDTDKFMGRVGK